MFYWSLPNGHLVLDKRNLSVEEWQRMLDCLALFKDGLVAVEHEMQRTTCAVCGDPLVDGLCANQSCAKFVPLI
jgi:hypothetical protein